MVYAEIISGMFIIPHQAVWRGYDIRRDHLWYRFIIPHQAVWRGYGIRRDNLWYRFIIPHQAVWRWYGIRRDHLWYVHYSPPGCLTWVWYTQRSFWYSFIIPHQAAWRGYGIRRDHLWYAHYFPPGCMTWVWYTRRSSISGIGSLFPTRLYDVGMVYAEIISGMFIIPHQAVWRRYGIRRDHLWYRFIIPHQAIWRGYGISRDHLWYVHYSPPGCMTWVWYTQRSSLVCSLFPTRLYDVGMVYAESISGMFIIPHQAVWRGYDISREHLWYRFIIPHQVVWRGYGLRRDHLWYVHYSPPGCMTWVWYTQRASLV